MKNKPVALAPLTPRTSGKKLFGAAVSAGTLRLVSQWINTAQKTGDLPDDDTLTAFANELWRAATRTDDHGRKMRAQDAGVHGRAGLRRRPMIRETIDGWECWVEGESRIAESEFSVASWSFEGGLTGGMRLVPTRVLGWLIKPLLRTAYAEGWADRNGQLDGAAMPDVYRGEP